MRKILSLVALSILFSCTSDQSGSGEITDYLSEDSSVILKLENPDLFFSNFNNNEFVQANASSELLRKFGERVHSIRQFSPGKQSFLSFYGAGDSLTFSFITKGILKNSARDSIAEKQEITSGEINEHTINGNVVYSTSRDSVFILSDSRNRIEKILNETRRQPGGTEDFERALRAASETHPVIFVNHSKTSPFLQHFFPFTSFPEPEKFSSWTSLDLEISRSSLRFNGISTAADSTKFINLFKDVAPARNELGQIAPLNSNGFFSFTFRDFSQLQKNLHPHDEDSGSNPSKEREVLNMATEAGIIYLPGNSVFAVKHLGAESREAFLRDEDFAEDFRGISIYRYTPEEEFADLLQPLVSPRTLSYVASLDNFILFSATPEALKEVIGSVKNERSLAAGEAYQNAFQSLSTESSLLWVNNSNNKNSAGSQHGISTPFDFNGFPVTALQFIYNGNFAHVHAIIEKNEATTTGSGVNQAVAVSLDSPLANRPVFFRNHRSKGMDIAVQDINNNLYLISAEGKIYWKKQLDSRVLGTVQQVDLYRNGRYQLAFATQNAVHILDRDGNPVKPFPLNFRDDITQPLAIFDYDNKRDYRFVVVQGEEVFMYNNKGNSVNGFKFSKASERITHPPKHIRLGNKDYILVPETSGRLNILSRTGEIRVPVKEEIAFSDNGWFDYEGTFTSSNSLGQLVQIDEDGKVARKDLELAENHALVATPKTLVTLSENELTIKDTKITLDFGLYTRPQIFYLNNKVYIGLTDTQAQRVYLFDSNGELIPGFPVYGTAAMDLENADADAQLELVVQGEEDSILIYELGR